MKKIIQITAIIALTSINTGYAGWLDTIRGWFSTDLGEEWTKLDIRKRNEAGIVYGGKENTIILPNLEPNKSYQLKKVGRNVYIKKTPVSPKEVEEALKPYARIYSGTLFGWQSLPINLEPKEIQYKKTFITTSPKGVSYKFQTFSPPRKYFTPKAEAAFIRTQTTE